MRKMKWKNFALLTLSVGMLCSCGGGSGVSLEKGQQIFEGNNIYFETGTSENVSAKVNKLWITIAAEMGATPPNGRQTKSLIYS